MASRRAAASAVKCLNLRTAPPQRTQLHLVPSISPILRIISKSRPPFLTSVRQKHTIPRPSPRPSFPSPGLSTDASQPPARPPQPSYELTFTCVPCGERSTHKVSKQGYHHGSVLIACPGCRNRHVIADHLKIFHDKSVTVEDLMRERGQLVKKGTLGGEEGDVEFWDDGSVTVREKGEVKKENETVDTWRQQAPGASFGSKAGVADTGGS